MDDRKAGSVVKDNDCSCTGPRLVSQKPAVTSSSREPNAFFQHLWALHACGAHTYMEANSHVYKIKFLNLSLKVYT